MDGIGAIASARFVTHINAMQSRQDKGMRHHLNFLDFERKIVCLPSAIGPPYRARTICKDIFHDYGNGHDEHSRDQHYA